MKTISKDNSLTEEKVLSSFARKKQQLHQKRKQEEERRALSIQLEEKRLASSLDRIEKELSHRELLDQEFRAAIALAVEKRVDASYRDLIAALDITKKHINIIDNVGNENQDRIIVIPGALFQRDASAIEGTVLSSNSPLPSTDNHNNIQICLEQQTVSSTASQPSTPPSPTPIATTTTALTGQVSQQTAIKKKPGRPRKTL